MELRPFTKSDWNGFASAAVFPDGSPPLLGVLPVAVAEGSAPVTATVVLDRDGLCLMGITDEGVEVFLISFEAPFAARAVAQLREGLPYAALAALPGANVDMEDLST